MGGCNDIIGKNCLIEAYISSHGCDRKAFTKHFLFNLYILRIYISDFIYLNWPWFCPWQTCFVVLFNKQLPFEVL